LFLVDTVSVVVWGMLIYTKCPNYTLVDDK